MNRLEERTVLLCCTLTGTKETEDLVLKLNNGEAKEGIFYGTLNEILDDELGAIQFYDGSDYLGIDIEEISSIKKRGDDWSFIQDSFGWHIVLDDK